MQELNRIHTEGGPVFVESIGLLEGDKDHTDHLGITTKAYGVVFDMKNKPKLSTYNARKAKEIGIDLKTATPEESKQVAIHLTKTMEKTLTKQVPNWNVLTATSKALVMDAKYNTGLTFKNLPKALEAYQKDGSVTNLKAVVKHSRRKAGGKNSKGMDNRVAKLLYKAGFIKHPNDARKLGLPLADVKGSFK